MITNIPIIGPIKYSQINFEDIRLMLQFQNLENFIFSVFIPGSDISKSNPSVQERNIWGYPVYDPSSDIVAILFHSDACHDEIQSFGGIATFQFFKMSDNQSFISKRHQNIRSRTSKHKNYGIMIQEFNFIQSEDEIPDHFLSLEEIKRKFFIHKFKLTGKQKFFLSHDHIVFVKEKNGKLYLKEITKHQNSKKAKKLEKKNKKRKKYFDLNVVFSISNDPCFKYSLDLMKDKGVETEKLTCYRFDEEVLYIETIDERFELARMNQKFRLSRLINPKPFDIHIISKQFDVPLNDKYLEVINNDLDWLSIKWSEDSIYFNDFIIYPKKCFWIKKKKKMDEI
ncbi:hypothetical protein M0811_05514 [Anaeramoeba ignava]|uniref:Uncharacterized protein n=1 Tax=Anaeramoeba ignava TaxID=1746090 RepID=A0A9Q0LSP0_ANAIG|nr:hypothetical protein M0811_05514 [Anaeramoeba ignava]